MHNKKAHIVIGLQFGDEGKGTMVDWFCRQENPDFVVRFNGGYQAGHNVVTDDGRHHCFSSIGSGYFAGIKTILSKYMMWNPFALVAESDALSCPLTKSASDTVIIDERAPVVTPWHVHANVVKEFARGNNKHGSCGKGIGELAYDLLFHPDEVIRAGDLKDKKKCTSLLQKIQKRKLQEIEPLWQRSGADILLYVNRVQPFMLYSTSEKIAEVYEFSAKRYNIQSADSVNKLLRESNLVMEGAQGVLLDQNHGFHPYTTWSDTTQSNAIDLLIEADFLGDIETTGVIRSYMTRHGVGPFPSQVHQAPERWQAGEHNQQNGHQGNFRYGFQDALMLRYASDVAGSLIDNVALTHTDCVADQQIDWVESYKIDGEIVFRLPYSIIESTIEQEKLTNKLLKLNWDDINMTALNGNDLDELVAAVEFAVAGASVKYFSSGPKPSDKTTKNNPVSNNII